jgi:hypothetical protein
MYAAETEIEAVCIHVANCCVSNVVEYSYLCCNNCGVNSLLYNWGAFCRSIKADILVTAP